MIVLFIFCALRGADVDRDYQSYVNIYGYIVNGYHYAIEPTFYLITYISELLTSSPVFIFIIYAALAISFKYLFIKEWSPYLLLSVLVYFSSIFLLHDMTQIRIGVASSIGFFSLKYIIENNYRKYYLWILVAILFHFSMVVFIFIPLLNSKRLTTNFKLGYLSLLLFLYVLYTFKIDMLTPLQYVTIGGVQEKYNMYKAQIETDNASVNVFSVTQILHILIVFLTLSFSRYFEKDKKMILIFKLYALSPLCLIAFSAIPGFSIRLSELFSISEIVFLPMLATQFKHKGLVYFIIIAISLFLLLLNLYYVGLVKEYVFI
ncbi:EpsG family protein [Cedecea lapagei]|nr:EpsG family protein [Cedecea lapagei]